MIFFTPFDPKICTSIEFSKYQVVANVSKINLKDNATRQDLLLSMPQRILQYQQSYIIVIAQSVGDCSVQLWSLEPFEL
jgi:hypothetical protein